MTATVTAKVTLDTSGVAPGVAALKSQVAGIGPAVQSSLGPATQAVNEHGAAWQRIGGQVTDALGRIAAAVGIAFSLEKIISFTDAAIDGAERIQQLSQTLGVSTQNLQAFGYIAGLTGTTLDTVSTSLTRLERAQVEARDGNVQTAAAFSALGVSVTDATGKLKPADQLIVEVAQHLATMADGQTKASISIQLMGRGAAESIPFLNALGKEFETLKQHAIDLGVVLSSKDQASLVAFKESTNELGQEVKGLGNQFAIALLPVLTQVVGQFSQLATSGQAKQFLQDVANGAKVVVDNFNLLVQIVKTLVEIKLAEWAIGAVGGFKQLVVGAGEAKAATLSLSTAMIGLGTFIAGWNIGTYLFDQFLIAKQAGAGFVGIMLQGWENIKAAGLTAWAYLKDGWNSAEGLIEAGIGKLASGFATLVKGVSLAALGTGQVGLSAQLDAMAAKLTESAAGFKDASAGASTLDADLAKISSDYKTASAAIKENTQGLMDGYEAQQKHDDAVKQAVSGQQQLNQIAGQYLNTLSATKPNLVAEQVAIANINIAAALEIKNGADAATVNTNKANAIKSVVGAYTDALRAQGNYNSQQEAANKLTKDQQKDLSDYEQALDALTGKLEGPYVKAQQDYNIEVSKAHDAYLKDIADKVNQNTAIEREATLTEKAAQVRDKEIQQLAVQHNLMAQTNQDLQNQLALNGVAPQYQQAITDGLKQYDDLLKTHYDFYGKYIEDENDLKQNLQAQLPVYIEMKQRINDVAAAQKNNEAISKEWQGIVANGFSSLGNNIGDFVANGLKDWKSFGQSLISTAKQFISQIIAEFLKLEVFNGIINSLFGLSGSSALPTGLGNGILGSIMGGGGGVTGIASSFFGGGSATSLAATDPAFMPGGELFGTNGGAAQGLTNGISGVNGGNGLMGWLLGNNNSDQLATTLTSQYGADVPFDAESGGFFGGEDIQSGGSVADAGDLGQAGGGFSVGTALSVAGAIFAGYNEFKAAGGGIGGVAGGAAYGTATFVAGTALTAGLAAAATSGIAAGAAAGLAAIGPIGWVALAAVAVNMISGGKLFGTAGKVIGGSTTETVDASGASQTSQFTTKGQKAFFGGSVYKSHDLAVDPAQQAADAAFFGQLVDDKTAFATSVGQTAGAIIGGTFTQNFDKKGNPTTTSTTVAGQGTFTGETQQQFGERVEAANFEDVMRTMGINIDDFTKNVVGDADKLLAATQDAGATTQEALADIHKGVSLLGDDGSVADVVNEVIKLNNGSETLQQTYQDLQVSVQSLKNDMMLAADQSGLTGTALVEFANDAMTAAGGASALQTLIQQFDAAYYTSGAQGNINVSQARSIAGSQLSAIGEDPNETMQQFKTDFDAIRDTLSPADLVAWYQAGVALANVNTELQTMAAAQQKYADFEVSTQGDAFVQAMVKADEAESAQIDTANQLAEAAGKAGASQADLAVAVANGTVAVGEAIATLTQGIDSDIQNLFGIGANDGLTAMGVLDFNAIHAQQQAQQAQVASSAFDLIQKLGDFQFVSGSDPDKVLAGFGLTAEQLGAKIGETGDQVRQQIAAEASQAGSLVTMAAQGAQQIGLLTDLLEVMQGKPTTFDINSLSAAANPTTLDPNKVGSPGYTLPGNGGTAVPARTTSAPGTTAPAGTSDARTPSGTIDPISTIPTVLQQNSSALVKVISAFNDNVTGLTNAITRFGLARPVNR